MSHATTLVIDCSHIDDLFIFIILLDPINTFTSSYETDYQPIRLSYHNNTHYNSVIHPFKASIGQGLGLPGHQPGVTILIIFMDMIVEIGDLTASLFVEIMLVAYVSYLSACRGESDAECNQNLRGIPYRTGETFVIIK